jgi:hypothetical protein
MIFVPYTQEDIEIANSYLAVAEAIEIISGQNGGSDFLDLGVEIQEILLIQSTLAVDSAIPYQGTRTIATQTLRFPVDESFVIPRGIKFATAILALKISNDDAFKNIKREKISKHETEYFEALEVEKDILVFLKPFRQTTIKLAGIQYE